MPLHGDVRTVWGNGRDAIYVYDGEPENSTRCSGDGRDL